MAKETNLTALNEIAEKCGGTAQASNAKAIKEIADNFSGGGGGGGEVFVINADAADPSDIQTTTTYAEVVAAWEENKRILVSLQAGGNPVYEAFVNSLSPMNGVFGSSSVLNDLLQICTIENSGTATDPAIISIYSYDLSSLE